MVANNPYKLDNMLISSSAHLRSLKLKAYFKATKDLHFDGLPSKYYISSMARMQDNRYLMHAFNGNIDGYESYYAGVDTLKAKRLELNIGATNMNCFVEGDYTLAATYYGPMTIFKDLREIGQIDFEAKYELCKNDNIIRGRNAQQACHSVYAVDYEARLYRIEWQDIKDGKYQMTLVKSNVEHFYVDGRLGLATIYEDYTLSLPSDTEVDLKAKIDARARWTIVTSIAKYWIACGDLDLDGQSIMASISNNGDIRSKLTLKLTSNGYVNKDGVEFAGIYILQNVFTRGRRGIILAIERDGCCHLISVMYGRLSKLQSIASIVNVDVFKDESYRIVQSVTATGTEGEFIVGGWNWTKKITLKLK